MQAELEADLPALDIQILGINEVGHDSGNASMTEGRSLPWLQDIDANSNQVSDVWTEQWNVVFRDVVIVDSENQELGAFNVTTYNLADAENYATLRDILVDVASDQPFWQNEDNPLDVNGDGFVSAAGDVLPCVNELNNRFRTNELGQLPALRLPPDLNESYFDVSGDRIMSVQADVLPIINFLNNQAESEGESPPPTGVNADGGTPTVFVLQTGSSADTTSADVLADPLSIPVGAAASRFGVSVFGSRSEELVANFATPPVLRDSGMGRSDSLGSLRLFAATGGSDDDSSTSLSLSRPTQQQSVATELNEEVDDLDVLAADVAAIWSWT